ncbi:hypothetical protein V7654_16875, partial [Bacillus sp. JJ1609]|uniref:hypothetical protein n=1 Tax=Bacillus sp. JJ1609 TaxID=3122977 RepID=UPI003000AB32
RLPLQSTGVYKSTSALSEKFLTVVIAIQVPFHKCDIFVYYHILFLHMFNSLFTFVQSPDILFM